MKALGLLQKGYTLERLVALDHTLINQPIEYEDTFAGKSTLDLISIDATGTVKTSYSAFVFSDDGQVCIASVSGGSTLKAFEVSHPFMPSSFKREIASFNTPITIIGMARCDMDLMIYSSGYRLIRVNVGADWLNPTFTTDWDVDVSELAYNDVNGFSFNADGSLLQGLSGSEIFSVPLQQPFSVSQTDIYNASPSGIQLMNFSDNASYAFIDDGQMLVFSSSGKFCFVSLSTPYDLESYSTEELMTTSLNLSSAFISSYSKPERHFIFACQNGKIDVCGFYRGYMGKWDTNDSGSVAVPFLMSDMNGEVSISVIPYIASDGMMDYFSLNISKSGTVTGLLFLFSTTDVDNNKQFHSFFATAGNNNAEYYLSNPTLNSGDVLTIDDFSILLNNIEG